MSVATEQFRRAKRNASTKQGRERGISKIENLLKQNGYPENAITRTKELSELSERRRNDRENKYDSILKVPFINDDLARDVRRAVRSYDKKIRVVFQRGLSLKDMLVSSSLNHPECPRVISQRKKKRGWPCECRACDAGMKDGQCIAKDVIYTMSCSLCDADNVGETERCVRERFEERYRQVRALTPGTRWGMHYASHHPRSCRDQPFL